MGNLSSNTTFREGCGDIPCAVLGSVCLLLESAPEGALGRVVLHGWGPGAQRHGAQRAGLPLL